MKRILVLCLAAGLFAGCGGNDVAQTDKQTEQNDQTPEKAPGFSVSEEVTELTQAETEFTEKLQALSAKATNLQVDFQFAEAAKTWQAVEELLTTQFGAEAWQTVNAKMAKMTASHQAEFDGEKTERLREVFNLQNQVGEALRNRDMNAALSLSERSTKMTQELFGMDSFMMGKQLMQLARMNQQAGQIDRAATLYLQSTTNLKSFLGEIHPDLEIGYAYLGEIFLAKNNKTQAITHLSNATAISRKLWGEGSLRYAARANDLGVAYYRNGNLESAIKILRAAESIRRGRLSASHPQVAHSLSNLGIVYLDMKRTILAEQCLEQSHDIFIQHYGANHALSADCKSKLATVKMLLSKNEEAEKLLGDLIAGIPDDSDPTGSAKLQYRLAIALAKQGKYTRAEPLFETALNIQKSKLGEGHQATIKTMQGYAMLLKQSNREKDAQAIYQQIEHLARDTSGDTFRR